MHFFLDFPDYKKNILQEKSRLVSSIVTAVKNITHHSTVCNFLLFNIMPILLVHKSFYERWIIITVQPI